MPDDIPVVVDANIVIAASIYDDSGRSGPVKHRIHDEASALLERLAESGSGYVVPAVRSEAVGAMARAVGDALPQGHAGHVPARIDPDYYKALERSNSTLRKLLRSLNAASPDPSRVEYNLSLVRQMSKSLLDRYSALTARSHSEHRRGLYAGGASGNPRLPPEAWQLRRFAKKHPNRGDQRVLAEAAAFRDSLPAGSRAVTAPPGTGFFSPHRHPGGVSDAVTAEIRRRFGILCDHPEAVLRMIGGAA